VFRSLYEALPEEVHAKARKAYRLWRADQSHPRVHFERIRGHGDWWSARVDQNYRSLCVKTVVDGETQYVWFWIGPHDEYDRIIKR
jgi:hypothetical protein